jgi:myo-inositol-1-phosphate synthase
VNLLHREEPACSELEGLTVVHKIDWMSRIRIAIAGVGNCASSLVQGISHYAAADHEDVGLLHPQLGGFAISDIEVVAAFDIDRRKVGVALNDAIFALPNNTKVFCRPPAGAGPIVRMGPVLDGVSEHLRDYPPEQRFEPADAKPVDVARTLRESGAEILVNYLPVGSQRATEHYAQACLDAGVSLVNCIPVFIASDATWANRFKHAGIPIVGDDIKAQVGATITHRTLAHLFQERGVHIDATYQLNTGGNTDFLNMLNRQRLATKKVSKTDAVQSQLDVPLPDDRVHIGPSDYIPFLKDNKVCFLRIEGRGFGGVPMHLELRLSVEDSPNSAGVVVDAIRVCKLARDAGMSGPIEPVCAWTMKHPPVQMDDHDALQEMRALVESCQRVVASTGSVANNRH